MLFNSLPFVCFALAFFALWPLVRAHRRVRFAFLVAASLFFYGWWDWRFVFVLLMSGLVDFAAGLWMRRNPQHAKAALVLSVFVNLGVLAIFKYPPFFLETSGTFLGAFGADVSRELYLPVGISFFTFQSMSYTIDIYRGRLEPTRDPLHFFAYLALFPQLVAGPIVRAKSLLPQLERCPHATTTDWWDGLRLIATGYFKKVVIADQLAPFVDQTFSSGMMPASTLYWWSVVTLFGIQIYCDFSGYSDIAIGLGRWMGLRFPENFRNPYLARSFREFWSRWHISLSTWFRDYVYIPLGGSRQGVLRGHVNLWVTMLLCGLWHGASWRFVVWGGLHAAFVSVERMTQWPKQLSRIPAGRVLSVAVVFVFVSFAWTFFRAESFAQAFEISRYLWVPHAAEVPSALRLGVVEVACVGVFVVMELWATFEIAEHLRTRFSTSVAFLEPVALGLMLACSVFLRGPGQAFIYFQF